VGGEQWADEQGSTEHAQHVLTRPGGLSAKIAADGVPSDARLPIARCYCRPAASAATCLLKRAIRREAALRWQHAFGGCLADFLHRHPEIRLRRWGILASDGFAHFANVSSDPGPDGAILFPLLEILPIPLHRGRMTYGQSRSSLSNLKRLPCVCPWVNSQRGPAPCGACVTFGGRCGGPPWRSSAFLSRIAGGADEGEGTCSLTAA